MGSFVALFMGFDIENSENNDQTQCHQQKTIPTKFVRTTVIAKGVLPEKRNDAIPFEDQTEWTNKCAFVHSYTHFIKRLNN